MKPRPFDPENIKIGDRVKVDFPMSKTYVIGTVRDFVESDVDWRYKIEIEKYMSRGRVFAHTDKFIYPLVNGTSHTPGYIWNTVKKIINPKTCRRCGATSQGGVYCPNGCGRI